jgi:hypothetical protein
VFALGASLVILSFFLSFFLEINLFLFFKKLFVFESDRGIVKLILVVGLLLMLYAAVLNFIGKK